MIQTIHATEQELKRIFSDDYFFRIPAYQRPYAWTTSEAGTLLDDVKTALGNSEDTFENLSPYFLGSLVLIKDPQRPEADVVDGQQRLTTITILLAIMRDLASEREGRALHEFLCEAGSKFKGTQDRFRLTLRSRDAAFFEETIQRFGATKSIAEPLSSHSDSQKNILRNAALFRDALSAMAVEERERLGVYLTLRCFLVAVSASDRDSAYRIFSVMNSRGLDLSPTDILKADVIGALPVKSQDKYTDAWEQLEEDLGRERFTELFAHIRMIYRRAKQHGTLQSEFLTHVKPLESPANFIDKILTPMARAYQAIANSAYESTRRSDDINRHLDYLNRLDNVDWVPPAILWIYRNGTNPDDVYRFLVDLERLAYGQFIIRANINDRIYRYADLIGAISAGDDLWADKSPLQLLPDEKERIVQTLEGPFYPLVRVRLPVLLRLDESVSDGSASYAHKLITVEHVLPQTPANGSQWLKWFPDDAVRERYVHQLGNLALLSHAKNSQAQNFEFDRKKKEYFIRKGVSPFALTSQVLAEEAWTPDVVQRRQKQLVQKLASIWRLR